MNQERLQTEVDRCLKAMEGLSPEEAEEKALELFMEAWRELPQADKDKLEAWADQIL